MVENDLEERCPTCGQLMKHIKSKNHHTHSSNSTDDTISSPKSFDIFHSFHCLNCDEEWEKEIKKNLWKKHINTR